MPSPKDCSIYTAISLGVLLTVILVPLSLRSVDYWEYGLKIRKTSGRVDTSKVYGRGRYHTGPTYDFLKYQADAHHESLDDLSVFSSGDSNETIGLEFKLNIEYSYHLNKDEVGLLHEELAGSYREIIHSRAKDALKNEAIFVSFTEYFQDRKAVEKRLRAAVQKRWNTQPSVHCTLDQFHVGRIEIPESVAEKQLESRVQNERNDQEAYHQEAQIERELTAVEVNSIFLEKEKVLKTAEAAASATRAKAASEAAQIRASAEINGTAILFEAIDMVSQDHMSTFTYIRNLASRKSGLNLSFTYVDPNKVDTEVDL